MNKTKIDWCDSSFNPVSGCYHGCEYCYARNIAKRFSYEGKTLDVPAELQRTWIEDSKGSGAGNHVLRYPVEMVDGRKVPYPFGFAPTLHRYRLNDYVGKKGRNIFVCSMADLFGDWVPDSWIEEVFSACEKAPQHNYLFLTKNPGRYIELDCAEKLPKRNNMWYGSTVTDPDMSFFCANGFNTFCSIEPILHPFDDISPAEDECPDWFIIGAETGKRKDKVVPEREWIENVFNAARSVRKPVFMKSSLAPIWGEPLIQEFPEQLKRR